MLSASSPPDANVGWLSSRYLLNLFWLNCPTSHWRCSSIMTSFLPAQNNRRYADFRKARFGLLWSSNKFVPQTGIGRGSSSLLPGSVLFSLKMRACCFDLSNFHLINYLSRCFLGVFVTNIYSATCLADHPMFFQCSYIVFDSDKNEFTLSRNFIWMFAPFNQIFMICPLSNLSVLSRSRRLSQRS